jgi:hypothetical protein
VIIMIGATVITAAGGAIGLAVIPLVVGLLATVVAYGRRPLAPQIAPSHRSAFERA